MSDKERQQTLLGPDCRITGEMILDGDGVIMGQFKGTVRTGGMLEVTDSANVSGTIVAGALRLAGHADGDVVAEHGVELAAGSELSGRLYTSRLSVVDGAAFEGEVVVGPKAMSAAGDLLHKAEGESTPRPRTTWSNDNASRTAASVETLGNSLDKILQQHRVRKPVPAEVKPGSNGA